MWRRFQQDIRRYQNAILLFLVLYIAMELIFGTTCMFKLIFGIPCPFCGVTRALWLCCFLKFKEAWQMQPLFPFVAAGAPIFMWSRYGKKRGPKTKNIFLFYFSIVSAAAVIFYVFRMYYLFPNKEPMTWWNMNLMSYLKQWVIIMRK